MAEFEFHFRLQEDGRIRIKADTEDEARLTVEDMTTDGLKLHGEIDFEEIVLRTMQEVKDA